MKKFLKKEIQVAFSKYTQPMWFRIIKYVALVVLIILTWKKYYFWWLITILIALALVMHFYYRYKTKGWTKSFGMWDHDKVMKNRGQ